MDREKSPSLDPALEKEVQKQLEFLKYGTVEITPEDEFVKMLRHSIQNNKPLRVKCGIDPTSTDVHLGHTVPYRKMRQFQDLGHTGVVIIGDYTAGIGDPTGKNESRPPLSADQIKENATRYMEQVYTVLNKDRTEICYQTQWFSDVGLREVISWAAQTTVAKLISHETFKDRIEQGHSLGLHELFYPVLQGIDSVYVKADVELGGTDQKFNVLMGRDYQKNAGLRPQVAILLPIITGTCGTQKMSKSLGNTIGILDAPFDKFGKVMSIPDHLMPEYYKYASNLDSSEIEKIIANLANGSIHPNETKKQLASLIVGFFHGEQTALEMRQQFENVFKKGDVPDDAPEMTVSEEKLLLEAMVEFELCPSKGEGRRLIKQNAVSFVSGEKITDENFKLNASHDGQTIKVGKRKFLKIKKA